MIGELVDEARTILTSSSCDSDQPVLFVRRKKLSSKQEWNRQRKLSHAWTTAENSRLIAAVRKRRALWDGGYPEYKTIQCKSECWKAVAEELATPGIDAHEAKLKWNSVRSNFKSYLAKHRALKSSQGVEESFTVIWPHFKELMFIEYADVAQSGPSTTDLPRSAQRRKRASGPALTRTATPSPPTSSQSGSANDIAPKVLSNLQPHDRYSEFGNEIAAHLRNLQPDCSMALETRIGDNLNEFLTSTLRATSSSITQQAPKRRRIEQEYLTTEADDVMNGIKVESDEYLPDLTQDGSAEVDKFQETPLIQTQSSSQQPVNHNSERTHVMDDAGSYDRNYNQALQDDECDLYGALLVRKLRKFDELERGDIMLAIDTLINERTKMLLMRQKNAVISN